MLDRCYLTEAIPVQIIWGSEDVVVPVRHAHMAHAAMPGSQLEIFENSGHFPFHDDPARFLDRQAVGAVIADDQRAAIGHLRSHGLLPENTTTLVRGECSRIRLNSSRPARSTAVTFP